MSSIIRSLDGRRAPQNETELVVYWPAMDYSDFYPVECLARFPGSTLERLVNEGDAELILFIPES